MVLGERMDAFGLGNIYLPLCRALDWTTGGKRQAVLKGCIYCGISHTSAKLNISTIPTKKRTALRSEGPSIVAHLNWKRTIRVEYLRGRAVCETLESPLHSLA